MAEMKIEMVLPEGVLLEGSISKAVLPGAAGEFAVMPGHISMVTPLQCGAVEIQMRDNSTELYATSGGMCEVHPDKLILALRTAEKADEIDVSRAENAKGRAEKRLRSQSEDIDMRRAEAALKRAVNRINVSGNRR